MSIVERVKYRAELSKPRRGDCILYVRPLPIIADEYPEPGEDFHFKAVFDHTDRHLVELEGEERSAISAPFFAKGGFVMLGIHTPTDKAISKIRMITYSPVASDPRRGVLNIKLARDECFMVDVWTHPEFRRQAVAFTLAYEMGRVMDHLFPEKRWVMGYAHKENEASQALMVHVYGMWAIQEFSEVEIGKYFVSAIPGSDEPKFGPFSKVGRHSGAGLQMPGRPRSGELYRDYHHPRGFAKGPLPEVTTWLNPGPDWFDNDHPLDGAGNPATPETMPREFGDA